MKEDQKQKTLRILFVVSRFPSHTQTGDRVRADAVIRGLSAYGHCIDVLGFEDVKKIKHVFPIEACCNQVYKVAFDNIEFKEVNRWQQIRTTLQGLIKGYPRRVWQFHSSAMIDMFNSILQKNFYDIIHFSEIGVAELCTKITSNKHVVIFDLIDAVSLSVENSLKYRFDLSWPIRLIEVLQLKRLEKQISKVANSVVVVSDRDAKYLTFSNTSVIPLGLKSVTEFSDYYTKKKYDFVFVGNLQTPANVDGINWFLKAVWPKILKKKTDATLALVGRNPPLRIGSSEKNVLVTGEVPDISDYLAQSTIFIAPLRYGAGQKNKVLEAMIHKMPIIATNEANSGTNAIHGLHLLIARSADEFCDQAIYLLENEKARRNLGRQGYEFVMEHFLYEKTIQIFDELYRVHISQK